MVEKAKLKQCEEEYNNIQTDDEIKELKQTIFNVLKCNVDYGDDKKLQDLNFLR